LQCGLNNGTKKCDSGGMDNAECLLSINRKRVVPPRLDPIIKKGSAFIDLFLPANQVK